MREISLSVCLLYVMVLIIKRNWTEDAQNNNVIALATELLIYREAIPEYCYKANIYGGLDLTLGWTGLRRHYEDDGE